MEISEFEFRSTETFLYIRGYLVWRGQKEQARDTSFLAVDLVLHKILLLRQFGTVLDKYWIKIK